MSLVVSVRYYEMEDACNTSNTTKSYSEVNTLIKAVNNNSIISELGNIRFNLIVLKDNEVNFVEYYLVRHRIPERMCVCVRMCICMCEDVCVRFNIGCIWVCSRHTLGSYTLPCVCLHHTLTACTTLTSLTSRELGAVHRLCEPF